MSRPSLADENSNGNSCEFSLKINKVFPSTFFFFLSIELLQIEFFYLANFSIINLFNQSILSYVHANIVSTCKVKFHLVLRVLKELP